MANLHRVAVDLIDVPDDRARVLDPAKAAAIGASSWDTDRAAAKKCGAVFMAYALVRSGWQWTRATNEVGRHFGVAGSTVRGWCNNWTLQPVRVPGLRIGSLEETEEMMAFFRRAKKA